MKPFLSLTLLLLLTSISVAIAQDIIIKNDKSEIKSKVIEITDTQIKYKKWDNIDGPIYNLSKSEAFMIIYANGQRETIGNVPVQKQQEIVRPQETTPEYVNPGSSGVSNMKNERVSYAPSRIIIGAQAPLEFGLDQEIRVIKNFLNLGFTYTYGFPKDEDILSTNFYSLYAGVYLPLNRVMKNYDNQNKGLFIFCHPGVSFNSTKVYNSRTYGSDTYSSDFYFTFRTGLDYFFSDGFGINLSSYNFQTYYAGVSFKF